MYQGESSMGSAVTWTFLSTRRCTRPGSSGAKDWKRVPSPMVPVMRWPWMRTSTTSPLSTLSRSWL